jgi:DNA modification methylase
VVPLSDPHLAPQFVRHTEGLCYSLEQSYVVQGDCRNVLPALPSECVPLIFADFPYFLRLGGNLQRPSGRYVPTIGKDWDEFEGEAEYQNFLRATLTECRRVLTPDGSIWVGGMYQGIDHVGAVLRELDYYSLGKIIWRKPNAMPNFRGARFQMEHEEFLWATKSAKARYTFNYHELKALNGGKQMGSIWEIPSPRGSSRRRRGDGTTLHDTEKPVALLERVILACSRPGDLVLDPCAGTGTTGEAALRLGRRYFLVERNPGYIESGVLPRLYEALDTAQHVRTKPA